MFRTLLFIQLLLSVASTVFSQTTPVDSTEMITLRIDPANAVGGTVTDFFDEVTFIPLETNKESLFGSIAQLSVASDKFVIFDYDTKAILIFNQFGKFVSKITASRVSSLSGIKGIDRLSGFSMASENNQPIVVIHTDKYFLYFDLSGEYLKKVPINNTEFPGKRRFSDGTEIKTGFIYKEKDHSDSTFYQLSLIKEGKVVVNYLPADIAWQKDEEYFSVGENIFYSDSPYERFFVSYYDYNIYKVSPNKLSLAYRLLLPSVLSLPLDFKTNNIYKGKREEYFRKFPRVTYGIGEIFKFGSRLYFKMQSYSLKMGEKNAFIYDLSSKRLTAVSDIQPDRTSSFLPLTDAGFHYEFATKGYLAYSDPYIYTSYSSLAFFRFKELNSGKNIKYSPDLDDFFKTQNKKSNPVLIQLKPRK